MDNQEAHSSDDSPDTSFTTISEHNSLKELSSPSNVLSDFGALYSENVTAKLWRVAAAHYQNEQPKIYPHTVPQVGTESGKYEYREADFWTCGFFPGSLYTLLERSVKFPKHFNVPGHLRPSIRNQLLELCRYWDGPIRDMAGRTDTHDMGFIVQPALRLDWELNGNAKSLERVVTAAHALASRWDERVKAIRSWDEAINYRYSFVDREKNFLVIIDSMCNLDLLCYVGHHTNDPELLRIANEHAYTILKHQLRPNGSTHHLVNFNPATGLPQGKMTNQGYSDTSTWSRGQAWGILGFAQMYQWTQDPIFLATAIQLANYFLKRLDESEGAHECPYVPLWDFDAPIENGVPLRDTSAGLIAVNGMLILHQVLVLAPEQEGNENGLFLKKALRILRETVELSLDDEQVRFISDGEGKDGRAKVVNEGGEVFEGVVRNATANWNPDAHKPYKDHGLVYADYYFLEAGNKLLRLGLV